MMRPKAHHCFVIIIIAFVANALFGVFPPPSALAVEPFCPGGSNPNPSVVWCDDFEAANDYLNWDIGYNGSQFGPADFVQCTAFGFNSNCASWTADLQWDRQWGYYGFDARPLQRLSFSNPGSNDFYIRWYQYISNPYTWGTLEDKSVLIHDQNETLLAYVGTNRTDGSSSCYASISAGAGMPFVANYQDLDYPENP